MPAAATAVFALVVVVFVSQSGRLGRLNVGAPIVFSVLGTVGGATVFRHHVDPAVVRGLAEVTLALVLFHDAAQVKPRELRADSRLCARLLLLGLPLTMLAGYGAARLLLPDAGVWLALLLAAALAPTDAGLGAATVLNPVVPARVRRLLNVESGLNDGLATPVVLFAIAASTTAHSAEDHTAATALRELGIGLLAGIVVGAACGLLLSRASRAGFVTLGLRPVAAVAVPLLSYFGCVAVGGNGFVAAFISGIAADGSGAEDDLGLAERISTILGYAVWSLFGLTVGAHLGDMFTWHGLLFALLSLTVLRMVPVAVALLGSGLRRRTVLFIGWFGPRGLASVVFALLTVEASPAAPHVQPVLGSIAITVFLSVILHGVSAGPWANRYGNWVARERPAVELAVAPAPTD